VTVVDARGLRCPAPVLRLARAAREAAAGTVLELWATDPAAEPDVRAWARMRGHEVLEVSRRDDDGGPRAAVVVVKVRLDGLS